MSEYSSHRAGENDRAENRTPVDNYVQTCWPRFKVEHDDRDRARDVNGTIERAAVTGHPTSPESRIGPSTKRVRDNASDYEQQHGSIPRKQPSILALKVVKPSQQVMLQEAIAIVMAPQDPSRNFRIFRLTDPGTMNVIQQCPKRHEGTSDKCSHHYQDPLALEDS
ncbi:hypothetical protein SELMODRAFT_427777 [Selaginella moellendorffii]|uniref:Uncharacterized protein n=1 Tax=Selaginella moellendorffii TaxID=88036 RepID=D8T0P0_SELML|nr:hypothetical protein SELMODRAFT_427777 [Selaginella moellendorffii]